VQSWNIGLELKNEDYEEKYIFSIFDSGDIYCLATKLIGGNIVDERKIKVH
jgi:hypothetical protein